jgi:hypothetical protein
VEQCDDSDGDFGMTLGVGTRVSAGGQEGIRSLGYLYTHRSVESTAEYCRVLQSTAEYCRVL